MATRTCYVTTVTLANGDRYEVIGTPEDLLIDIEDLRMKQEVFLKVNDGIYVKISDISSLRGKSYVAEFVEHKPAYEMMRIPGKHVLKSAGLPFCSCGEEDCQRFMLEGR